MDFEYTPKVQELRKRLIAFMDEHIYPSEAAYYAHVRGDKRWTPVPIIEELKPKARKAGLWNLFLPHSKRAPEGLSNLEYALGDALQDRRHTEEVVRHVVVPVRGIDRFSS